MIQNIKDEIVPIFILGAGHSGTTILYKMLSMHPDVAWFSQFSQRDGNIQGRLSIPCYNQIAQILHYFLKYNWHKKETPFNKFIVPTPSEAHQIWSHILPETKTLSVDDSDSVMRMRDVFQSECKAWNKSYLFVKLPRLHREFSSLRLAYPNAIFIHIVRDGRAVALSNRHKFKRKITSDMESLKASANYWLNVLSSINFQMKFIDIFEVKYEELCADVYSNIKDILSYINLDYSRFPHAQLPTKLISTNQNWLDKVTNEELKMLECEQKYYLKKYGYKLEISEYQQDV